MHALLLILALLFASASASAEDGGGGSLISPGDLASAHSKYEGISNCTQCHRMGGGIPDSKCLDCHDKLSAKMKGGKGLHANIKDPCIKCHADHKGRSYKMIVFEKEKFDHAKTEYPLKDKHAAVQCAKCHKKEGAYSVASTECVSCHKDEHKKQLGEDCSKCHNLKGWKDITLFSHKTGSAYPLEGRHIDVKCAKCHVSGRYKPIEFKKCLDCHKDTHRGQFIGRTCESCHTVKDWKTTSFDHNAPLYKGYRLEGKHLTTQCDKCHVKGKYKPIPSGKCLDCHNDPHKKQFPGKTCESCHTVKGWKTTSFDHAAPAYAGYRLEGKHIKVDCAKCHVDGKYKPLPYKQCLDCHKDEHKGQFKGQTCESCHTVRDWKATSFEHNAPAYPGYRLEGKHLQTKCDKCHVEGKYKPLIYKQCLDCHKDEHNGQFAKQRCEACHTVKDWKSASFDHNAPTYAGYRLEGKHGKVECAKCHIKGKYKPLPAECVDCHRKDDAHKDELGAVCANCHTALDWKKITLDHNAKTKFPLVAAHKTTPCDKCHRNKSYKTKAEKCIDCHKDVHKGKFKEECNSCHTQADWRPRAFDHAKKAGFALSGVHNDLVCGACHTKKDEYRFLSRFCNQCHTDPHRNQFGSECSECHTERSWALSKFKHSSTSYPLSGRHRSAECQDCHRNRQYRATSRVCVNCHLSSYSSAPNHLSRGYSQDCAQCHATNFVSWVFRHSTANTGCSSCHLNDRPSSHVSNPSSYPTTCENCHTSTASWSSHKHTSATTGCSSCHLSSRPSSHTSNPSKYPTTCENCHTSTVSWSTSKHISTSTGCSSCHLSERPGSHSSNPSKYPTTCELCHSSTATWSSHNHTSATTGCSSCHLSERPSTHTSNTTLYSTTCENCHKYPTWTYSHTATTGCSSCHLNERPSTHTSNTATYSTTCENCHKYPTWTWSHTVTTGCSSCHTSDAPSAHTTYASAFGTTCETCHSYPTWTSTKINHSSLTTFPSSHKGYSQCSDCHPSMSYATGNCINCHKSVGAETHNTTSDSVCLSCHPSGKK
ncbi:MAG: hypothetical protein HY955_08325 [Deltaproteobacteria bacterium]|nr:hypothetical protein [Deltaproteobacteria bacterium]